MCGTFYIDDEGLRHVKHAVDIVDEYVSSVTWNHDIHSSDYAPVITEANGNIRLIRQRWGYFGNQNKGVIFNARAESVREKKLFSNGIENHRAVIPAAHFYEWNRCREKNVFSGENGDLLYLAGFYDLIGNEERFVILTTAANESMMPVHDRMPLILDENQIRNWITEPRTVDEILRREPGQLCRIAEYEQMTLF